MHIGIVGPISVQDLAPYINTKGTSRIPPGLGAPAVTDLVLGLLRKGEQVTVITLDLSIDRPLEFAGRGLRLLVGPWRPRHKARDFFRMERAFLEHAIGQTEPDVVHAHWTYEFALAALASKRPCLITACDDPLTILRHQPDAYRLVRFLIGLLTIRRAPMLVANSQYLAGAIKRHFFIRKPIRVVPNAFDSALFELADSRPTHRSAPFTVASILQGGARRLKNGLTALQAFQIFRRTHPDSRYLVFGHGDGAGPDGWAEARIRGLDSGVEFTGEIERFPMLRRLACEADVLVHPSLEESFCNAVAEAMALGVPVIGGITSGAVPELLDRGANGLLVDVRSPAAIADALKLYEQDPLLRASLADRARRVCRERYHIDVAVDAYRALYSELLQRDD